MALDAPNEQFLRKEFFVPKIFEIMEPHLFFIDAGKPGILPTVPANSKSVNYKYDDTSASSDAKKKLPQTHTTLAKYKNVTVSSLAQDSAVLNEKGFEIEITRDAVRFAEGIDEIKRAFNRLGYWMAQGINTDIITAITDAATTPDWTPTAVWSAAGATPVDDLIRLEGQMEREGYPYSLTDTLVHKTNFLELKGYLTSADIGDLKQKEIYGMPAISKNKIDIPVIQGSVHKLQSGMTEGYVLGLDRDNPCGTIFFNNDPKYSSAKVTYNTVEAGKKVSKTVNNFGINAHVFERDSDHATVIQMWYDLACVVKEPYAALYDSGI